MSDERNQERWHLRINGRVQGVSYRASCEEKARSLGLTGYVRNLPDGDVEVVAEGQPDGLQQLTDWCWQGPPAARTEDITIDKELASGEFEGFTTR